MKGGSIANSAAEAPRLSARKRRSGRRVRARMRASFMCIALTTARTPERLVAERRSRHEQPLVACKISEVEPEQRHVDRPLIHQPHDHNFPGLTRLLPQPGRLQIP